MSQTWTVDSINTASTSPAEAWPMAIDAFNALRTGFSGTSRPTDIAAGQTWVDTDYASGVWAVYRVVTASPALDSLVGTIDTVTGQFVHVNGLIAATVTPASDADVTLTAAQNAAGYLVLEDGSWSTARNIIVDAGIRQFTCNNTGSYAKTVKTAAGTGVVVAAGTACSVICDGVNVVNPDTSGYRLIAVQKLTTGTGATLTLDARTRAFRAIGCGAGGGGGGVDGQGASTAAASDAGGGGGWFDALLLVGVAPWTYTVGAAGTGGASGNNAGTAGGSTTISNGTITLTATGGSGGIGMLGTSGSNASAGANPGEGAVTGTPVSVSLGRGTPSSSRGVVSGFISAFSNSGACPRYGGGRICSTSAANGAFPGEGGGSTYAFGETTNRAGADGFRGEIIIEEYE